MTTTAGAEACVTFDWGKPVSGDKVADCTAGPARMSGVGVRDGKVVVVAAIVA
ncbi:MAG TPA: hypothetical protein VMR97_03015 [Acidimicrobiales bacterium]|nr:hypothetical protein [Acidimicrobiales bacterium]